VLGDDAPPGHLAGKTQGSHTGTKCAVEGPDPDDPQRASYAAAAQQGESLDEDVDALGGDEIADEQDARNPVAPSLTGALEARHIHRHAGDVHPPRQRRYGAGDVPGEKAGHTRNPRRPAQHASPERPHRAAGIQEADVAPVAGDDVRSAERAGGPTPREPPVSVDDVRGADAADDPVNARQEAE
jgi:hypothetical protein